MFNIFLVTPRSLSPFKISRIACFLFRLCLRFSCISIYWSRHKHIMFVNLWESYLPSCYMRFNFLLLRSWRIYCQCKITFVGLLQFICVFILEFIIHPCRLLLGLRILYFVSTLSLYKLPSISLTSYGFNIEVNLTRSNWLLLEF